MTSPLDNLVATGTLHAERPDAREYAGLVRSGRVRLRNQGEYEGDLNVDERLVADVIAACAVVLGALDRLPPLR